VTLLGLTGAAPGRLRRQALVVVVLATLLLAAMSVALSVGSYPVPLGEVLRSLVGLPSPADLIVLELRLPRVATGVLAGAAFGLSGALFQAVIRNPLASPDLIGVTSGASVGAVLALTLGGLSSTLVPLLALTGGVAAGAAVYLLANRGGVDLHRLVVVGIALGGTGFAAGALTSGTSLLLIEADISDAQSATVWLTGSLHGSTWERAVVPLVALLAALPLLPVAVQRLRAMSLGDDVATGLGVRLGRTRLGLVALGVMLAAAATSAVGPIGFVALGSPQIARRLMRLPVEPLVGSALVGAVVVTVADVAARQLFAPTQLPAGVFTAAVGGPYLLWLLTRPGGSK
jgi:iron complex transport system permease protein